MAKKFAALTQLTIMMTYGQVFAKPVDIFNGFKTFTKKLVLGVVVKACIKESVKIVKTRFTDERLTES